MRTLRIGTLALLLGLLLPAATLEKLSLEDMIQKSTTIVRGRVAGSYAAPRGSIIYTHYTIQVSEQWKGSGATSPDVVVPGGASGGLRQAFPGAPKPILGQEYVFFLWAGPSGLTHIIGLSQGLLSLQRDQDGNLVARRAATAEVMLNSTGRIVRNEPFSMRLNDLKQRISSSLGTGGRR